MSTGNPSEVPCFTFYLCEQIHSINPNGEDRKMSWKIFLESSQYLRTDGFHSWCNTPPVSGERFAFVLAEASLWQRYHGPTLMYTESRMGPTGLGISSGRQGEAVV